jgi:hypothetical protein
MLSQETLGGMGSNAAARPRLLCRVDGFFGPFTD